MITLYSKNNCSPCKNVEKWLPKLFKEGSYNVIKYTDDKLLIDDLSKFNVSSVPTIVINDKVVLNSHSLFELISAIKHT